MMPSGEGPVGLLPCPFCGSGDLFVSAVEGITCRSCRAEVIGAGNDDDATVWNRRAPTPSLWRPIEEAPRDGTRVLAVCATASSPEASIGWWANANDGECWYHYSRPDKFHHGGVGGWFPTHFQPLPAPPLPPERASPGEGEEG